VLSKKIPASGANCLFIVIDRLTNLQGKKIIEVILGRTFFLILQITKLKACKKVYLVIIQT